MCAQWPAGDTSVACARQYEIMLPALTLQCDQSGAVRDRRNILLFYGFLGVDLDAQSSAPAHYVYMKLETSSYASLAHAVTAAVHYGRRALRLAEKSEHDLPKRREDQRTLSISSQADYQVYSCAQVQARARAYDAKLRAGDEFFVPQQINDTLQRRVLRTLSSSALSLASCPV